MKKCRLCLQEKKLINAHIIPKFIYKGMKNDKNRFSTNYYDLKRIKSRNIETAEFDKNILCEKCDNEILGSIYEKYAEFVMFDEKANIKSSKTHKAKNGDNFSILYGIDYKKMKLFLLSLLWRASITSRPFFKEVNLGSKHEERIREMLIDGIIPEELEYPIITTSFIRTEMPLKYFVGEPKKIKFQNNINGYSFIIRGFQYIFLVNSMTHSLPNELTDSIFNKKDEMTIFYTNNLKEYNFLKNILN
jgi:hypothetical protein